MERIARKYLASITLLGVVIALIALVVNVAPHDAHGHGGSPTSTTSPHGELSAETVGTSLIQAYDGPSTHGYTTASLVPPLTTVQLICALFGENVLSQGSNPLWYYTDHAWIPDHYLATGTKSPRTSGCLGNVSAPHTGQEAPTLQAGPFPVLTDEGTLLPVRSSPTAASAPVGTLQSGDIVVLQCSVRSHTVNPAPRALGAGAANDQWDRIVTPIHGWVPDSNVDTHTSSSPAPRC
jgi:hypothetical protein